MASIGIYAEEETFSNISNNFIDYYMTDANGDFVKLYIYLARLSNAHMQISVSDIADHLRCNEKDVCRGIRYWIKQDVLKLSYDNNGEVNGIIMCALKSPLKSDSEDKDDSLRSLSEPYDEDEDETPVKSAADDSSDKNSAPAKSYDTAPEADSFNIRVPEKLTPSPKEVENATEKPEISNLISEAKAYCQRDISPKEINSIIYIYETLHFSFDLSEFLLEYCASLGKTSFAYIESVAINWYRNGITTRQAAEEFTVKYGTIYSSIMKEMGIVGRNTPTSMEKNRIDYWRNDLGFDDTVIIEACRRGVAHSPNNVSLNYINAILESWEKGGVRTLADIAKADTEFRKKQNRKIKQQFVNKDSDPANEAAPSDSKAEEFKKLQMMYINGGGKN